MKYVVTELNHPNEQVMLYCSNTYFSEFNVQSCNAIEFDVPSKAIHCTQTIELDYTIVDSSKTNFIESKSTNVEIDMIF